MGNVVSVSCDPILSRCLDCTIRRAKHVRDLEDNLRILQTESQKLFEARNDVMRKVEIAERKQMKRMDRVQGWLKQVQDAEAEVDELLKVKSQQIEKLCLGGYCSKNCKSSYKFGKEVAKILKDLETLWGERPVGEVVERVPENVADEIPFEPTTVGLQSSFDNVWRCLGNEQVGIIGIYGTGGVGKTTLLKQIHNSFCNQTHDFDVIIWVVVSKEPNFEKIQEVIGKKIDLFDESWMNRSLQDKARDIFNVLKNKRFVLFLDDIWKRIDLTNQVGVPLPSSGVASKIMFTTRFLGVCGSMKAKKSFRLECLRHEEAWKLFQETLQSDVLESHPDIPELAETVAKECGGLPLALLTVSRAMACKKTPEAWRYAIHVLRNSAYKFTDMETEVYRLLKFSYDSLPSDIIRSCLLYCSLFPEDCKIRKTELIDCWIGEELLDKYNGSKVYDQGYANIGVLVDACLLEEEENEEEIGENNVKMHDVIRDMVLWIACEIEEKEKFLVQAGMGLTEPPEIGKWKGVKRISLMENKIMNLSETPVCPDLQTLFLNNNRCLKMISSNLFEFMHSLKVLKLRHNRSLIQLPSGISRLVSLQYLDLSYTDIKVLPMELKNLVNLKCLGLDFAMRLSTIPRGLITKFSKLNVLRMFFCGFDYCDEDSVIFGGGELLVEELLGLKYLNVLNITLRSSYALQSFLSSVKLQSCTKCLYLRRFHESKSLNILSLANLNCLDILFIDVCKDLEELKIENLHIKLSVKSYGFTSLVNVAISSCFKLRELTWLVFVPNLKFLSIRYCDGMEEIISVEKLGEVPEIMANLSLFVKLQYLVLVELENLKSIYWKALPFPHLKEIEVRYCPNLKKLPLDSSSAKEHKIIIEGQEEWWKEVQWEDEATQNAFLHCFKS